MRIAFLHQPNDPYTLTRIKYFLSRGHTVYSITFPRRVKQKVIPGLYHYPLPSLLIEKLPFVKRFIYFFTIKRITKELKPDIFHIVNALSSFYVLASAAKKNVIENQGSDVIRAPKRFIFMKKYYRWMYKYADGVIQDSKLAQGCGISLGAPENLASNRVIEIGVNFDVFNKYVANGVARSKIGLNKEPIVFCSRGLKRIYNIDTIIFSIPIVMKKYKNIKYVFTGQIGDCDSKIIRFIQESKLENNIIFCGKLDHDKEIKYYYRDANVTVSVPLSDSSPASVHESMACMTPVIISDLPWIEGKFIPGRDLVTVPVRDHESLASAIISVLDGSKTIDVESAYNIVRDRVNMDTENERLEVFYTLIVNKMQFKKNDSNKWL